MDDMRAYRTTAASLESQNVSHPLAARHLNIVVACVYVL